MELTSSNSINSRACVLKVWSIQAGFLMSLTGLLCWSCAAEMPSQALTAASQNNEAAAETSDSTDEVQRKIIYTAEVSVYVNDFDPIPDRLTELVQQHQGFISEASRRGTGQTQRRGDWTVRIPVDRYREFLASCETLGELSAFREQSREVTAEYYDLQARLKSKQLQEQRLLEHLQNSTSELKDILLVETELGRVRSEIEQMQGRQRLLDHQTAFSTVTIIVIEAPNYVPSGTSASFWNRVTRTWSASWNLLFQFIEGVTVTTIALVPWLLLFGLPLAILVRFIRRRPAR